MNSTAHTRSAPSSRVAEWADDSCRIVARIERPNIEDRGAVQVVVMKNKIANTNLGTSSSGPGPRRNSALARGQRHAEQLKHCGWKRRPIATHTVSLISL